MAFIRLGVVHILPNRWWGGSLSKWLQYNLGGGLAKWLQYYMGVVHRVITVLHKGAPANDEGIPWILGYYI